LKWYSFGWRSFEKQITPGMETNHFRDKQKIKIEHFLHVMIW